MIKEAINFFELKKHWLGEGGHPVAKDQAQSRANVCLKCSMNVEMPIYEMVAGAVALQMRRTIALKNQMNLRVDGEKSLHICSACKCLLKVKPWVPLKFVLETTKTEDLHPDCWVLIESKKETIK